jgi:hypothetical protein
MHLPSPFLTCFLWRGFFLVHLPFPLSFLDMLLVRGIWVNDFSQCLLLVHLVEGFYFLTWTCVLFFCSLVCPSWRAPKFLVRPNKGLGYSNSGIVKNFRACSQHSGLKGVEGHAEWRTPKSLVRPTWGSRYVELRKVGTWEPLLTSSTERGKRGVLEVPGLD